MPRSGLRNTSPSSGALPPGANTRRILSISSTTPSAFRPSNPRIGFHILRDQFGDRKAFIGIMDCGDSRSFIGSLPKFAVHFKPAIDRARYGDRGRTPIGNGARLIAFGQGLAVATISEMLLAYIPVGARPMAFRPCSFPVFGSHMIANKSPPMPLPVGSTTPSTALPAIAASTALPPSCKTSSAVCVASGWLVATMPFCAITADRLAPGSPE